MSCGPLGPCPSYSARLFCSGKNSLFQVEQVYIIIDMDIYITIYHIYIYMQYMIYYVFRLALGSFLEILGNRIRTSAHRVNFTWSNRPVEKVWLARLPSPVSGTRSWSFASGRWNSPREVWANGAVSIWKEDLLNNVFYWLQLGWYLITFFLTTFS